MIIDKYNFTEMVFGKHDCLTMLLEAVGDADSLEMINGKYRTLAGGLKRLPAISGHETIHDYLLSKGYSEIKPTFAWDGDIAVQGGCHTMIFTNGQLFGVKDDNTFGLRKIDILEIPEDLKIYRAP